MTRLSSAYVLVTPARNEAGNIEQTLESVMAQTIPPLRWIIVDDGSTDATVEIVRHATLDSLNCSGGHPERGGILPPRSEPSVRLTRSFEKTTSAFSGTWMQTLSCRPLIIWTC
jgi:glycosyltransferase involved in cell wall biosynthesis